MGRSAPLPHPVGPYPGRDPADRSSRILYRIRSPETLGIAYETNPQLTGERAHVRATDERRTSGAGGLAAYDHGAGEPGARRSGGMTN